MSLDPQTSWVQWALSGILTVFTGLLALIVSLGREAQKIYRLKVDNLEEKHASFAANCITRDELKKELNQRFDDMDVRRLQMHNHNADLLTRLEKRFGDFHDDIEGIRSDIREDLGTVHRRIDELKP